jgi:hypothetical protein
MSMPKKNVFSCCYSLAAVFRKFSSKSSPRTEKEYLLERHESKTDTDKKNHSTPPSPTGPVATRPDSDSDYGYYGLLTPEARRRFAEDEKALRPGNAPFWYNPDTCKYEDDHEDDRVRITLFKQFSPPDALHSATVSQGSDSDCEL